MPDVFITYSRKNTEFVRRLVDIMEKQGRDVWVDWEDIPPTVDWMQEIRVGIDGSSNYVFVITPDSLASKVCLAEIEHALAQEKKLIPVLHQDVEMSSGRERRASDSSVNPLDRAYSALGFESDSQRMLEYLSPHNWIFFREEDDFEKALATFVAALDDDQDFKNEHTRLLVRAREWDSKNRDKSFLLTDAAIKEAETWLEDGESKSPKPTDLHHAYINASRLADLQEQQYEMELQRAAARRLGYLAVALTVFLIAAIALSLFAFSEQGRAQNAQSTSEASFSTSDASLATSDASLATSDASLSTTEASRATSDASLSTTEASRATSDASLSTTEASLSTSDANREIAEMAQATAVRRAIEAESFVLAERARLSLENGDTRVSIRLALEAVNLEGPPPPAQNVLSRAAYVGPRINFAGHRRDIVQMEISPDETHALTASDDGTVILWDIATGSVLLQVRPGNGGATSVAFNEDGDEFLAGSEDGSVGLWEVESGEQILDFDVDQDIILRVGYGEDEDEILVASCTFRGETQDDCVLNISRWDPDTGAALEAFDFFFRGANIIDFSPDGRWVAIASEESAEAFVVNVLTAQSLTQITTVRSNSAINFDASGQQLALASGDGSISIFNVFSGDELKRFQTASFDRVSSLAFSGDSSLMAAGLEQGTTDIYDLSNNEQIYSFDRHAAGVSDVTFLNNNQNVLTASYDSTLQLWDMQHGAVLTYFDNQEGDEIEGVAVSADGALVYGFTLGHSIITYDSATGEELGRLALSDNTDLSFLEGRRNILHVAFTPGYDAVLALMDATTPHLIDLATGEEISELVGHEDDVSSAVFSPDGRTVYTGGWDGQLIAWDAASGEQIRSLEIEDVDVAPYIISMDISDDGSTLVAGTVAPDSIAVWDTGTGDFVRSFSTQQHTPDIITLSPDASIIATAGGGSTIILWDIVTGAQTLRLEGHVGEVNSILFNADGTRLISGSDDRSIIVWDIVTGTPLRQLEDHTSEVTDVVFGPDETTIYSSAWTDSIIEWRLDDIDALVAWTCQNRAVIDLTEAERAAYGVTSTTPLC